MAQLNIPFEDMTQKIYDINVNDIIRTACQEHGITVVVTKDNIKTFKMLSENHDTGFNPDASPRDEIKNLTYQAMEHHIRKSQKENVENIIRSQINSRAKRDFYKLNESITDGNIPIYGSMIQERRNMIQWSNFTINYDYNRGIFMIEGSLEKLAYAIMTELRHKDICHYDHLHEFCGLNEKADVLHEHLNSLKQAIKRELGALSHTKRTLKGPLFTYGTDDLLNIIGTKPGIADPIDLDEEDVDAVLRDGNDEDDIVHVCADLADIFFAYKPDDPDYLASEVELNDEIQEITQLIKRSDVDKRRKIELLYSFNVEWRPDHLPENEDKRYTSAIKRAEKYITYND